MAKVIEETSKKMTQLCRKMEVRWAVVQRVTFVGQFFRFLWNRLTVCSCSLGKPPRYRRLQLRDSSSSSSLSSTQQLQEQHPTVSLNSIVDGGYDSDSDLVNLKISLLGDCHIGKTTFLVSNQLHFLLFCLIKFFISKY